MGDMDRNTWSSVESGILAFGWVKFIEKIAQFYQNCCQCLPRLVAAGHSDKTSVGVEVRGPSSDVFLTPGRSKQVKLPHRMTFFVQLALILRRFLDPSV